MKASIASPPDWLEIRPVSVISDTALDFLDAGEREAISLAQELDADALIIDKRDGREVARARGMSFLRMRTGNAKFA